MRENRTRLPQLWSFGALLCIVTLAGCNSSPGKPAADSATVSPNDVLDFRVLYSDNCAGCHGAEGQGGPAIALADPVYLAIVDDATIRKVIAIGVPHTAMPAFAQSSGGMLTEKQVDVLANTMRATWGKPNALAGATPPSYAAKFSGDAAHGAQTYKVFCESCHGLEGHGSAKGSAIADTSFLALVSDQYLRTLTIVGRPELAAPDWRSDVSGHPLSEQEITDVVAWLAAQRVKNPGQPYPAAENASRH
jgi:mono/diheme cytochrome c family protein